jgi:hypothetical protein
MITNVDVADNLRPWRNVYIVAEGRPTHPSVAASLSDGYVVAQVTVTSDGRIRVNDKTTEMADKQSGPYLGRNRNFNTKPIGISA